MLSALWSVMPFDTICSPCIEFCVLRVAHVSVILGLIQILFTMLKTLLEAEGFFFSVD